jgi:hypothetical protein
LHLIDAAGDVAFARPKLARSPAALPVTLMHSSIISVSSASICSVSRAAASPRSITQLGDGNGC